MAESSSYSLSELADAEGVTPRTVRYYIAQGLLPPPAGAGPLTRYGTGHLLRLRLIRELQRQHLPLAEIRARLERLDDDAVFALVAALERPAEQTGSAIDYIRAVLAPPSAANATWPSAPVLPLRRATAPPPAPIPPASPDGLADSAIRYPEPPPRPPAGANRSQWERIVLAPDLELHVRRPLSRLQNRAVDRLIGVARQLLEEDPS